MGRLQAEEMSRLMPLEQAVRWHLQHNHYPPVPPSMVEPCIEAIEQANNDLWEEPIALPEGVTYKGRRVAPAYAMVEQHHLESFLNVDGEA